MTPEQVIRKIAEQATIVAFQAGVGASETAGQFVSFLTTHPDKIDAFLDGTLDTISEPDLFRSERGCLSWHGADGKIHTPAEVRAIRDQPDA